MSRTPSQFDQAPTRRVATFNNLSYEVKTRNEIKRLVDNVSIEVSGGEMFAIMGPSGAGKTTLLDLMSCRKQAMDGHQIEVMTDGTTHGPEAMSNLSSYVAQDDQLMDALSVDRTISFASRLSHPDASAALTKSRVDATITDLGLESCSRMTIGKLVKSGISDGQKRRVAVGCGLVTLPKILFLDEPTSGLDPSSARDLMTVISRIAKVENIIVIATIHASSIETVQLFDKIMILAKGRDAFQGTLDQAEARCVEIGHPIPAYHNPAGHLLDLVATDFGNDRAEILDRLCASQRAHGRERPIPSFILEAPQQVASRQPITHEIKVTAVLIERSFVNYSRSLLAGGIRVALCSGMILLATIWIRIRLGMSDGTINDRIAVYFFSIYFLAFMAVAGIPAFLQERQIFMRERKNGMYGPLPFVLANTTVNLVFLFACTLVYTIIFYLTAGLQEGSGHFFRFLAVLFLGFFIAETQAHLIASIIPSLVASLTLTSFLNLVWMCVQGSLFSAKFLSKFWYYTFHFINYQKYVFEALATNDLVGVLFKCDSTSLPDGTCACVFPPSAATIAEHGTCIVSGQDVVDYLELGSVSLAAWTGILVGILVILRLALYLVLRFHNPPGKLTF